MKSPIFDRMLFMSVPLLGDAFAQNGIVNWFADRSKELHLVSHRRFLPTIQDLYQDHPNIIVTGPDENNQFDWVAYEKNNNLSKIYAPEITFYDVKVPRTQGPDHHPVPIHWDQQMYEFYDLSFSLRYTNFRLPKNLDHSKLFKKQVLGNYDGPYAIIHSTWGTSNTDTWNWIRARRNSLGLDPNLPCVKLEPTQTPSILSWYDLIKDADEVHCVPSGPQCFVDSIWNHCKGKLYYHWTRIETHLAVNNRYNQNCWQIELYDTRLD